jgi:hypothetical protein
MITRSPNVGGGGVERRQFEVPRIARSPKTGGTFCATIFQIFLFLFFWFGLGVFLDLYGVNRPVNEHLSAQGRPDGSKGRAPLFLVFEQNLNPSSWSI